MNERVTKGVTSVLATPGEVRVIKVASIEDLPQVNQVIEQAVMGWPLSERLRRLSLPLLTYNQADWQYYQFLSVQDQGKILAIAAWDPHTRLATKQGQAALLHGLYVAPASQGRGIGWQLLQAVSERALLLPVDGVLIKAERIAVSYFKQRGLLPVEAVGREDYPYQFWLSVKP